MSKNADLSQIKIVKKFTCGESNREGGLEGWRDRGGRAGQRGEGRTVILDV